MIGKNNKYLRDTKSGVKVETYSIKKFKVGAASVVIGASIFFGAAGIANAGEVPGEKIEKDTSVEKVTSSTDEKTDVLNNNISAEKEVAKPTKKEEVSADATPTVKNDANADKKVEKKALDKNKLQTNIEKVEELLEKINKDKAPASTLAAIKIDLENAKNILNSNNAELTQAEIDVLVKKLNEKISVLSSMPKANAPEKVVKEGKNTIANTGSRDSRNGNKIEEGTNVRAASISPTWDSSDNLLIYQRHRASDGSRVVRNGLTEYTEKKVDMFAKTTTINGERYVVYDVFFNNDGVSMAHLSRYQIYRLILPPQILDLNSDGTYKNNTLRDLKFESYTRNGNSGTLSQNPENFTRTASHNVNFLNNSVDYGSGWRKLTYFNALDIRHGRSYNQDMSETFKGNSNDPLLIHAVTRTESKFNQYSYGFGVKTEDRDSAIHMQVKAKLKAGVTDDQVREAFALAVAGTFGKTTNQAYTFVSGKDANEPKYTDYPDQPVQPTLREKQAKLYPIQGSTHNKTVGDTLPNPDNPVSAKYITPKNGGEFPGGMTWSWKNNIKPSTAEAGVFKYTAVATYQDGSKSDAANSGSDGTVTLNVKPIKPTITASDVQHKKGLTNQTITVNVG
ncbi:YSIRK-type signal peptide-containing protein, partial [uncultured Gemella sp.]|uniref:YSIRK-type signal peptide-containing protein n=1 Tax=uncultured Gemella sp. TaxID=254352 RepID=UPI0028D15F8D